MARNNARRVRDAEVSRLGAAQRRLTTERAALALVLKILSDQPVTPQNHRTTEHIRALHARWCERHDVVRLAHLTKFDEAREKLMEP